VIILKALESPESFVRHSALTILYNLGHNAIVGTLHSIDHIRALIKLSNDIACSDEVRFRETFIFLFLIFFHYHGIRFK
jgi:hypothetical protein